MEKILNFCKDKNILLEDIVLKFLSKYDIEKSNLFILKISEELNKKFISRNILFENKNLVENIIKEVFFDNHIDVKKDFLFFADNDFNKDVFCKENSTLSSFNAKKIEVKDFVYLFRYRYNKILEIMQNEKLILNLSSINKVINSNKRSSLVGMVFDKKVTKNGNIILGIEDLTGKINVVVSKKSLELFENCENISLDSVLGFVGSIRGDVMFLEKIIYPELKLLERNKENENESVAFIGDIHFGSINFMEKNFDLFINYLEGDDSKEIKYLFIVGDLVSGMGIYPGHFEDLKYKDIKTQFFELSKKIKRIRKDIKIIIIPGNHDGSRLMEPQPSISSELAFSLLNLENVYVFNNPSNVFIGKSNNINVLCYHGFSFPYYYNNIPSLLLSKSINSPVKIMKYLLKNRHLAPTYSSVQCYPSDKDFLLIENAPDIFVSGHIHKLDVSYENNILFISVSSWEKMTPYQKKLGNNPDFCKVPVVNLKTRAVKILDFERVEKDEDRN